MSKLIQICASENDLFGLDGEGVVYHYNFGTKDWIRLGRAQRDRGVAPGDEESRAMHTDIIADGGSRPSGPSRTA